MLAAGARISGRYEIVQFAASGGMAQVYRARDLETGEDVALKVLMASSDEKFRTRFSREAALLATLTHPRIVRFVSSGELDDGQPFFAMQWIDGQTLSRRLKAGPLTADEATRVVRSIAEGVAYAHERGFVHRDLKPANVMLRNGEIDAPVVLDFGIARSISGRTALTLKGTVLGTVGYMSPEQFRDPDTVDRRTDVFALGCILYQCLTGQAPFSHKDVAVVIGRILLDPTPIALAPNVPEHLTALAASMMSRSPADRPSSAGGVLLALESPHRPTKSTSVKAIGNRERRRGSLILVSSARDGDVSPETIEAAAAPYGARSQALGAGLVVVSMPARGAAVDQAVEAVRCALAIRDVAAGARVTVVTGQSESDEAVVFGEIFGKAVDLEREDPTPGVRIDALTSNLVGERFEQATTGSVRLVVGERSHGEPARRLLGHSTPFVGRERELASLEGIVAESLAEHASRIAVVLADAGLGKSRLRAEVVARLRAANPNLEVWNVSGDPRAVESPFALLRALLSAVFRLQTGEPSADARRKIATRLGLHADPFICELLGVSDPEEKDIKVLAARSSPQTMADQTYIALERFVEAEASDHPLVVVIDDAHWADEASCAAVERLARSIIERPFVTLVFARQELEDSSRFEGAHLELRLSPLSARSAERVVRAALPKVSDADAQAIIARASGNAFFLEELVRAHAQGGAHTHTVVTALQARIEGLHDEHRRLLRAASVIGEVFWLGAAARLMGTDTSSLVTMIDALVSQEVLMRSDTSRYVAQTELAFRHALLRDAAFAMVTEEDRRIGHVLFAKWLEELGEPDARLIAERLELGGEGVRASAFWLRAASRALDANAFREAVELTHRAMERSERQGEVLLVRAEALAHYDEVASVDVAARAAALLDVGSLAWYRAQSTYVRGAARTGKEAEARNVAGIMLEAPLRNEATRERVLLLETSTVFFPFGESDRVRAFIARSTPHADTPFDPVFEATREVMVLRVEGGAGSLGEVIESFERSRAAYRRLGDMRMACTQDVNLAYHYNIAGAFDRARALLDDVISSARRINVARIVGSAHANLAVSLLGLGLVEEAERMGNMACAVFERLGDMRLLSGSRMYVAQVRIAAGNFTAAIPLARQAVDGLARFPKTLAVAKATLAHALLAAGDVAEALQLSTEAKELVRTIGHDLEIARMEEVHVRALLAANRLEDAKTACADACAILDASCASLAPGMQAAFDAAPAHRDILALARSLLGRERGFAPS